MVLQGRDRNGVSKLILMWRGVGSNKPQLVQEALRIGPETSSACLRRAGVTIGMMASLLAGAQPKSSSFVCFGNKILSLRVTMGGLASLPLGSQPRHSDLCILKTKYWVSG